MSQNIVPALLTGLATFAVGTLLQGVHPAPAAIVSIVGFFAYWLGSDWMDEKLS